MGDSFERETTLFWNLTYLLIHLTLSFKSKSFSNCNFYQIKVKIFELKLSFLFWGQLPERNRFFLKLEFSSYSCTFVKQTLFNKCNFLSNKSQSFWTKIIISFLMDSYERKTTLFWSLTFLLIHLTLSFKWKSFSKCHLYDIKLKVFELKSSFHFSWTVTRKKLFHLEIWLFFFFI